MTNVLCTQMTSSMSNRAGYLTIKSIEEDSMDFYTFKDCIKIENCDFHTWLCYWENSPLVVKFSVKASKLPNGFVKVVILDKELINIEEIGDYPAKRNHCYGYVINNKFSTENNLSTVVSNELKNISSKNSEKKNLSEDEIKNFKEQISKNWGCTLK